MELVLNADISVWLTFRCNLRKFFQFYLQLDIHAINVFQVFKRGTLSSISAMAFESAHYQLTRCIARTTSASYVPELIVKRFLRQFYSNKPKCFSNKVVIRLFTLWQACLVEFEELQQLNLLGKGPVFNCSSFSCKRVRYYIHNKCNFPDSGCFHFAIGVDEQGNNIAVQLLSSYFSEKLGVPLLYVNVFPVLMTLVACMADSARDSEISAAFRAAHPYLGSSYCLISPVAVRKDFITWDKILFPCIVFKAGKDWISSRLIADFEHD